MAIDFDLRNTGRLIRDLGRKASVLAVVVPSAMLAEAETIMVKSKREVPVDTGTLRSSGRVGRPVWKAGTASIDLTYGGPARDYAIYVHEDLNATHLNGKAKFLEDPVKAHAGEFEKNLARKITAALRTA